MLEKYLNEAAELHKAMAADKSIGASFDAMVEASLATVSNGGKILVAGNGGSAADAQHFAAEFVATYKIQRRAHPAIALTTDASILTAISNDYHFEHVFKRQVEALGRPGDIFFALTTSGNSNNLVLALKEAKARGLATVALLGKKGGKMKGVADHEIIVPSDNVPRIQEVHKLILHSITEEVERRHYATYLS